MEYVQCGFSMQINLHTDSLPVQSFFLALIHSCLSQTPHWLGVCADQGEKRSAQSIRSRPKGKWNMLLRLIRKYSTGLCAFTKKVKVKWERLIFFRLTKIKLVPNAFQSLVVLLYFRWQSWCYNNWPELPLGALLVSHRTWWWNLHWLVCLHTLDTSVAPLLERKRCSPERKRQ